MRGEFAERRVPAGGLITDLEATGDGPVAALVSKGVGSVIDLNSGSTVFVTPRGGEVRTLAALESGDLVVGSDRQSRGGAVRSGG